MEHLWRQEFQSWIANGQKNADMRLFWSGDGGGEVGGWVGMDLELVFVPPGAMVSGLEQTCRRVYVDETVHDFVHQLEHIILLIL